MAKTTEEYQKCKIRMNNRCPDCGVLIAPYKNRCQSCRAKKRWREGGFPKQGTGENSHAWKGGRAYHSSGYVMLWMPSDNRTKSGYMFEHIINWEKSHNETLPKGWVIHHLNGIRDDNRPENLVALSDRKHRRILSEKAKRIQMLEAIIRRQGVLL